MSANSGQRQLQFQSLGYNRYVGMMSVNQSALWSLLERSHPLYAGKLVELRELITGWLNYVPQTFPHYTRHTIEHSDKIIIQMSKLLFIDDDVTKPVIPLSGVETYILCVSALLHDCGMVASDIEKTRILQSEEWKQWIEDPWRRERLAAVDSIRSNPTNPDLRVRNFLADLELRFLVADFVRQRHHQRSGDLLDQHEYALGRFALDDIALRTSIRDICVAHGLTHAEISDDARFPTARDVRGEKANIRLMAILLRLGDLLDMDTDRACPLLMCAASPVPSDSIAHWTQYRRIVHRLTSPDRIEITAECQTQDEHRVLADWCNWIEAEVGQATKSLLGSKRHADWHPPYARVGDEGSIRVKPSANATYVPCTWKLALDEAEVLDRLIRDAYSSDLAFAGELLQNAIDATRCQLYIDVTRNGLDWPGDTRLVPNEIRERYPISISLVEEEPSGPSDTVGGTFQLLTIDDNGLGMTVDTIRRYFLQVGRSYYRTESYRRRFPIQAIGRHGVGFLSVFRVSDRVTVETLSTDAPVGERSVLLTLNGPRNYFLREQGQRSKHGTRVAIRLGQRIDPSRLVKYVKGLCKRVEFPIVVSAGGVDTRIDHESSSQFLETAPDLTRLDAKLSIVAYPFEFLHTKGEVYFFERQFPDYTSWADGPWANHVYALREPLAHVPPLPGDSFCRNGLEYASHSSRLLKRPYSLRLDYRGPENGAPLDRAGWGGRGEPSDDSFDPELEHFLTGLLDQHLEKSRPVLGDQAWRYEQDLADGFPFLRYWTGRAETIQVWDRGAPRQTSLQELLATTAFHVVRSRRYDRYRPDLAASLRDERSASVGHSGIVLLHSDVREVSSLFRREIFRDAVLDSIRLDSADTVTFSWRRGGDVSSSVLGSEVWVVPFHGTQVVGLTFSGLSDSEVRSAMILNGGHAFTLWMKVARDACDRRESGLTPKTFERLIFCLREVISVPSEERHKTLMDYLEKWPRSPEANALPPPPELGTADFLPFFRSALTSD